MKFDWQWFFAEVAVVVVGVVVGELIVAKYLRATPPALQLPPPPPLS